MFKNVIQIVIAVAAMLPGVVLRLAGVHLDAPTAAMVSGTAILGASFLLLWACDAAQADISQTLALAVVALIAVLPEYAVDMYFTWQAGKHPEAGYAHYAIANMTGANRLIIGVAWALIALIFWIKTKGKVILEPERRTEILFLGMATLYAFMIPIKGSLAWYDCIVFLALYAWYIKIAGARPCGECEAEGPAEILIHLPKVQRRVWTSITFLASAGAIILNSEPFCEGLIGTGRQFGINEFLLVQWLAPIASEAPEFIVATMMVLRGAGGQALGSLLSAKLNQWTLLVGMIPGVYALSSGQLANPIPMDSIQMHEILLTAAQSLLAMALVVGMRLGVGGASLLFALFLGQFLAPVYVGPLDRLTGLDMDPDFIHQVFSAIYIAVAVVLFIIQRRAVAALKEGLTVERHECVCDK